jgi:hypothetical protein
MERTDILNAPLQQALFRHLDQEAAMLEQIQTVSRQISQGLPGAAGLVEHQSALVLLSSDLMSLQLQREELRTLLAPIQRTPPEQVRLSSVLLASEADQKRLQSRQQALRQSQAQAAAALKASIAVLIGQHFIVTALLETLAAASTDTRRYNSSGQIAVPRIHPEIEMRS